MVDWFLNDLSALSMGRVENWSSQIHIAVLCILAAVWLMPFLRAMYRRLPKSEPAVEWVQLWRCPRCNTFNRRTFFVCTHCEYHLQLGGLAKWIPLKYSESFKRISHHLINSYRLLGWIVYYGLTISLFWKLQLDTFKQPAMQELLACIVMILFLGAILFFYRTLRPRLKSIFGVVLDLIAGVGLTGLACVFALMWIACFYPPHEPLLILKTQYNGQVQVETPTGNKMAVKMPTGSAGQINVQYAVFSWPVLGMRQVFIMRLSGKALTSAWMASVGETFSPFFQKNGGLLKPHYAILNQSFQTAPGVSYALVEPKPGYGLTLTKQ